jgi:hypothetical protein
MLLKQNVLSFFVFYRCHSVRKRDTVKILKTKNKKTKEI